MSSQQKKIVEQFEHKLQQQIPDTDARYLLTVSGGADSIALLSASSRLNLNIVVAHCNFHLRGEESDRDEMFVTQLCAKLGVKCCIKHFDTTTYCAEKQVSIEMGCRELRYKWFRELMTRFHCLRMCVAHNADDNIETMLLNLFRGSGIEGLRAMQHDNGEILRPLLTTTRAEIELYLKTIGQSFIVDSTNLQNDFKRNYIRNSLLPELETRWPGIRKSLQRSLRNIAGAYEIYNQAISTTLADNQTFLSIDKIKQSADRVTLLHEFIKPYTSSETIACEIAAAIEQSDTPTGKHWLIDNNTEIVIERNEVCIINKQTDSSTSNFESETLQCNETTRKAMRQNKNHNIVYLPENFKNYRFRHPRTGDRIASLGINGTQLISDILKDAKLSTSEKRNILILEDTDTGDIIWIPGLKRSRKKLILPTDTTMVKITKK